jgi:hypothetical protein
LHLHNSVFDFNYNCIDESFEDYRSNLVLGSFINHLGSLIRQSAFSEREGLPYQIGSVSVKNNNCLTSQCLNENLALLEERNFTDIFSISIDEEKPITAFERDRIILSYQKRLNRLDRSAFFAEKQNSILSLLRENAENIPNVWVKDIEGIKKIEELNIVISKILPGLDSLQEYSNATADLRDQISKIQKEVESEIQQALNAPEDNFEDTEELQEDSNPVDDDSSNESSIEIPTSDDPNSLVESDTTESIRLIENK